MVDTLSLNHQVIELQEDLQVVVTGIGVVMAGPEVQVMPPNAMGGSDGSNANGGSNPNNSQCAPGYGQGHTTRDFGESSGKRNAGGGGCGRSWDNGILKDPATNKGGVSDYTEGSGNTTSSFYGDGGGYGGGGGPYSEGGDGTVLIRGYKYE
nr:MAG TPA: hypothetical protein [Caudoviricetes sp.]